MGRKSILGIITIRRDSSHVKFLKAWRKSKTRSIVDSLCLHVEGNIGFPLSHFGLTVRRWQDSLWVNKRQCEA